MAQSIFNIEKEYLELAEQIIDAGGEVTEEQERALALNKDTLEVKAVKYGYVIKQNSDDITSIDNEIKRLQALKKSKVNLIDRLEDTVSKAMKLYEIDEIKLQNLKINFRSSKSVEIENEKLIPSKYKTSVTEIKISKTEIAKDIKAGIPVTGAVLKENKLIQFK